MKCPWCGKEISGAVNKCPHCSAEIRQPSPAAGGSRQERVNCPHCGKEVIKGAYRCVRCGKPLAAGTNVPTPAAASAVCPYCGKEIMPNASKCRECGKTIMTTKAPQPAAKPEKINCPSCGKEISSAEAKCPECGKEIAQPKAAPVDPDKCPRCGKQVPSGKLFCGFCGAKMDRPKISLPLDIEPRENLPISQYAVAALPVAVAAALSFLFLKNRLISLIPGLAAIALAVFAIGKIRRSSPGDRRGLALCVSAIFITISGLISPLVTLFVLIFSVLMAGFVIFYFWSHKTFGNRVTFSIIVVVGFGLLILWDFLIGPTIRHFHKPAPAVVLKQDLLRLQAAQKIFYFANHRYAKSFQELDWQPDQNGEFAFFLDPQTSVQPKDHNYPLPENLSPFTADEEFLVIAVGNIDQDETLDVWSMDSFNLIEHLRDDTK